MIQVEQSGDRRRADQTRDDRLREIKREEVWVDVSEVIQKLKSGSVSQA